MLRGIVAGVIVGSVATMFGLKIRDSRAAERAPGMVAQSEDLDALRSEATRLREATEGIARDLAEAEKEGDSASVPAVSKQRKKPTREAPTWKSLAPRIRKAFTMGQEGGEVDQKDMELAMLEMMSLLGNIAKARGITMDEAMLAPEGMPQLLLAMLESTDTPPTEAQRRAIQELLDGYARGWDAARPEGSSKLEQRLAVGEVQRLYSDGFRDVLTEAQRNAIGGSEFFGEMNFNFGGGSSYHTSGTRDSVAAQLTDQWVRTLKLDSVHAPAVRPIVEDYMAEVRALQARGEQEREGAAPEAIRTSMAEEENARLRAQLAAQRRLAGLAATPDQRKALQSWTTEYRFSEVEETRPNQGDEE